MYGNMATNNLFGLNDIMATMERAPSLITNREGDGSDPVFAAGLKAAISAAQEKDGTANDVYKMSTDSTSLSMLYKTAILEGNYNCDRKNSTAPVSDSVYNVDDSHENELVRPIEREPFTGDDAVPPSVSVRDVVFSTAGANSDLVNKINYADTMEERLGYVAQLRDKMVTALKEAGYDAKALESADKISVDGELYDIMRASKGMGRDARVQLLKVDEATVQASIKGGGTDEAIVKAAEGGMGLLRQISSSHNVTERRHLAAQVQQIVVDHLNANGYTASTLDSPDKIEVNGVTYDIIQGLNSPGGRAQFQTMRV